MARPTRREGPGSETIWERGPKTISCHKVSARTVTTRITLTPNVTPKGLRQNPRRSTAAPSPWINKSKGPVTTNVPRATQATGRNARPKRAGMSASGAVRAAGTTANMKNRRPPTQIAAATRWMASRTRKSVSFKATFAERHEERWHYCAARRKGHKLEQRRRDVPKRRDLP